MRGSRLPPVIFVLAVVTAFVLLGAAASLGDGAIDAPPAAAGKEVVGRFYDAVNAAIATGDTTSLAAVVAPEFVEHEPVPGLPPDRAGLERYLATLHDVFPQLRLTAEAVTAEGDLVMARTSAHGAESAAFLEIPLADQVPPWGRVDRFRVVGDMIVERWADAGELSLLQPLYQGRLVTQPTQEAPWAKQPPQKQVVSVTRVTHEMGGSRRWSDMFGQSLLAVEAGQLSVRVEANSPHPAQLVVTAGEESARLPEPVAPGTEVTLGPGQVLTVPRGAIASTRNDERAPAVVLVVTITTPQVTDGLSIEFRSPTGPPPVATQILAGALATAVTNGLATVAIGRATLAPGGELPRHQAAGPELVAVESGALALATTGEEAWIHHGADGHGSAAPAATLTVGDGALVHAGATASFRNSGDTPVVLLVVTLTLAES